MSEHKERDPNDKTTGHEWDGIQELDNPPPRWWVIIWIICIIWAFGYWVVYPAWPTITGHTKGTFGWTVYTQLAETQQEIINKQAKYLVEFNRLSLTDIENNKELKEFAIAGGRAAFKNNCAMCHGGNAAGQKGFPNLLDDDWIWGGKLEDIYKTIKYGIRSNHPDTRESQMPAFGKDGILTKEQIIDVAEYVMSLSNSDMKNDNGALIFKANCASCHGADGKGMREVGAPNLANGIWLYGGDKDTIIKTITYSRAGAMPAFIDRLDIDTIKQLAIYIHSLGGGE
jgi:cytochrome c oxidase cbb3-type subunit III